MTMIYVASSWRNTLQPRIVFLLRIAGYTVYDFRNPAPGVHGFSWAEIDPNWENWTPKEYKEALQHPIALKGYSHDIEALRACDACVLVLPSGRSASWEFGYAMGQGKRCIVVQFEKCEPELMYREARIATTQAELFDLLAGGSALPDRNGTFYGPELLSCDDCGGKVRRNVGTIGRHVLGTPVPPDWTMAACEGCGTIYLNSHEACNLDDLVRNSP